MWCCGAIAPGDKFCEEKTEIVYFVTIFLIWCWLLEVRYRYYLMINSANNNIIISSIDRQKNIRYKHIISNYTETRCRHVDLRGFNFRDLGYVLSIIYVNSKRQRNIKCERCHFHYDNISHICSMKTKQSGHNWNALNKQLS